MWRAGAIKSRLERAVSSFRALEAELKSDIEEAQQLQKELVPAGGVPSRAPLLLPGLAIPEHLSNARQAATANQKVGLSCSCVLHMMALLSHA
jgi:hypothetical protein